MSALAEMERELIVERTLTGLAVARAKPRFLEKQLHIEKSAKILPL